MLGGRRHRDGGRSGTTTPTECPTKPLNIVSRLVLVWFLPTLRRVQQKGSFPSRDDAVAGPRLTGRLVNR
jgi:hypothetical protein